jgi:hypothetical protein
MTVRPLIQTEFDGTVALLPYDKDRPLHVCTESAVIVICPGLIKV